jgi:hypothetical protein
MSDTDKVFAGSVPKIYEAYLVPLIFEPYAVDLVSRLRSRNLSRVLEIAAGTGVVTRAMASTLGDGVSIVATDLATGGFANPARIATVAARSRARSPRVPAMAYCQGTPLRNEIEARDAGRLEEATDVATTAIARRFGSQAVDGRIQAHVVTIEN